MPPVVYKQLQDDIYVYNMHLSRLFVEDEQLQLLDDPSHASSTQEDDDDDDNNSDSGKVSRGEEVHLNNLGRVIDEVDDPLAFMRAVYSTWRQQIAIAEGKRLNYNT
jgi:hypothetical protein